MGCRGQVRIQDENVYLYTHWGADQLETDVRKALQKRWRWNDPEYLARIVFEEMIGTQRGTETGYGIGHTRHGDIEVLITLNCARQEIEIMDLDTNAIQTMSFETFVNQEKK